MPTQHAEVRTEHASRYLQQLCKHWSHRFDVTFDADRGMIRLTGATLTLAAAPQRLSMTLSVEDPANVARLGEVVTEHLKRFAFREELGVAWTEGEGSQDEVPAR